MRKRKHVLIKTGPPRGKESERQFNKRDTAQNKLNNLASHVDIVLCTEVVHGLFV